jgi:molecular chaperone GrpE
MEKEEKDRKKSKMAEQAAHIKSLTEELEQAKEALEKIREESAEIKDQHLRLQAEWDNYRRRTAKERLELLDNAGKDILTGFLPVVDDCQRALKVLRESGADPAAIEGTELIYNKLMAYLKSRGVEPIEARGATFDTDYHEAVAQFPVEDPEKKNTVIDVTQEGYTLNGNVIRFAKVVVGI